MRNVQSLCAVVVAAFASACPRAAIADDYPIGPAGGDLTLTYPNPQVGGLQGHALPSFGSTGCLQTNGSSWSIGACGSGSFTAAGDLSGSGSTQEVIGILNHALPSLSAGYPHWTGSAWVFDVPGSGFAAGGDLSGTATSQTVAQISGTAPVNVVNGALSFGANPAASGALRLPNNTAYYARNAANSGDLRFAFYDAANQLQLGDPSSAVSMLFELGTGGSFFWTLNGAIAMAFGSSVLTFANTATSYSIVQNSLSTSSGTGHNFTLGCGQTETGTGTTIGGNCVISTGAAATPGSLHLQIGTTDKLILGTTGLLQLPSYSTGLAHLDSSGNVTSSAVNQAADITGITPAANGGTGVASLTAHNVVVGNGTGAVHFVPPVTSGFYLRDNGVGFDPTYQTIGWSSSSFCASSCVGSSGSTLTCPSSGLLALFGVGAGGGGGGGATGNPTTTPVNGGGGGGGGALPATAFIRCAPGDTLTVTLGTGGAGGVTTNPGSDGGDTILTDTTTSTVLARFPGAGQGGPGTPWNNTYASTTALYGAGGGNTGWGGTVILNSSVLPTSPGAGGCGGAAVINNVGAYTSTGITTTAMPGAPGHIANLAAFSVTSVVGGTFGSAGGGGVVSGYAPGSGGGGGGGSLGVGGAGGAGGAVGVAGANGGACSGYGSGGGGGGAGGNGTGCTSGCTGGSGHAGCPGALLISNL